MSYQTFQETIATMIADATAIANSTSEALLAPVVNVPANYMQFNRTLRGRMFGKLSTTGTPTIQFAIRAGGLAGTLLAQSETITTPSGAANINWSIEFFIQTRASGAAGALLTFADVTITLTASTSFSQTFSVSGFDAPAQVSFALDAAWDLAVTGKWSAASASNTITAMHYTLESMQ